MSGEEIEEKGETWYVHQAEVEKNVARISSPLEGKNRKFHFSTDCSGIDSPFEALGVLKLSVPLDYVTASEINPLVRKQLITSLEERGAMPKVYEDMLATSAVDVKKYVDSQLGEGECLDLYVAGPPCRSFSSLGQQKGSQDPRARVFEGVVDRICTLKPRIAIIENVEGLTNKSNSAFLEEMVVKLRMKDTYYVDVAHVNAIFFGSAQNRPRIFITIVKKDLLPLDDNGDRLSDEKAKQLLKLPCGNGLPTPSLSSFLLPPTHPGVRLLRNSSRWPIDVRMQPENVTLDPRFAHAFDPVASPGWAMPFCEVSPCFTNARTRGPYVTAIRRSMCSKEMALLQGFPDSWTPPLPHGHACRVLGDSIHVGTIASAICHLFTAIGEGDLFKHHPPMTWEPRPAPDHKPKWISNEEEKKLREEQPGLFPAQYGHVKTIFRDRERGEARALRKAQEGPKKRGPKKLKPTVVEERDDSENEGRDLCPIFEDGEDSDSPSSNADSPSSNAVNEVSHDVLSRSEKAVTRTVIIDDDSEDDENDDEELSDDHDVVDESEDEEEDDYFSRKRKHRSNSIHDKRERFLQNLLRAASKQKTEDD